MEGKKIKGRKRHIATDTLGNMLTVQVHAANIADTSQGWDVCDQVAEKYDTIQAFSGDQGYSGTTVEFVENLLGLRIDIAAKPLHGFKVIPKRWIVERTLAWLGGFRRLAKDFEILTQSAENMIRIAMIKMALLHESYRRYGFGLLFVCQLLFSIRYDWGLPNWIIRLRMAQPRRLSTCWLASLRALSVSPMRCL